MTYYSTQTSKDTVGETVFCLDIHHFFFFLFFNGNAEIVVVGLRYLCVCVCLLVLQYQTKQLPGFYISTWRAPQTGYTVTCCRLILTDSLNIVE